MAASSRPPAGSRQDIGGAGISETCLLLIHVLILIMRSLIYAIDRCSWFWKLDFNSYDDLVV